MRFWNVVPPSRFYSFSLEDRAYMIIAYEEEMKIQAVEQRKQRIKQEVDALKSNKSSED